MAGSTLWPLQGSVSEFTCLLDYSLGFSNQASLGLFFSPFKDKICCEQVARSVLGFPSLTVIYMLSSMTASYSISDRNNLSSLFLEHLKPLFKPFIFRSSGEEMSCINFDAYFTRKGNLQSLRVHHPS